MRDDHVVARRYRFEEKSYEVAYCVELASSIGGTRAMFSPGQVLEKLLGFDAAANPGPTHVLWRVLGLPRPPGVSLLPSWWSGGLRPPRGSLPSYPVSVFLQFKRPEYRFGPNAAQYGLWKAPYYRFERTRHQHTVLLRLERNLRAQAVVRYAAPTFDTVAELEYAQLSGTVIQASGHVGPSRLGIHKVWTYQQPGTHGIPNPNGKPLPFEPFSSILDDAGSLRRNSGELELYHDDGMTALLDHLEAVAAVCRDREPRLRGAVSSWSQGLSALELEPRTIQALTDFATVQALMRRTGCAWWLTG